MQAVIAEKALPWLTIIEKMGKQKSYKPILLLSLIQEIEEGKFATNEFTLTSELEQRFDCFYEKIGNKQGVTKSYQPFYFLQKDLWDIHWRPNSRQICPASNSGARKNIQYVSMRENLFNLLQEKPVREIIKDRLILKAEEDIKLKDIRKNPSFKPPNDSSVLLKDIFGLPELLTVPDQTHRLGDPLSIEFAEERLLQDFLVNRWSDIQKFTDRNLEIYGGVEVGVEYNTHSAGRIDILAEDQKTKDLTVIELKRGLSGERHLGQLLRYMGWVRSKLAQEKSVFGLLIAAKFSESIQYAITELKNVNLLTYSLNFELKPTKFDFY